MLLLMMMPGHFFIMPLPMPSAPLMSPLSCSSAIAIAGSPPILLLFAYFERADMPMPTSALSCCHYAFRQRDILLLLAYAACRRHTAKIASSFVMR